MNNIRKKIYDLKATRATQLADAEAAAAVGDNDLFEKHMGDVKESNRLIEQQEALLAQKEMYTEPNGTPGMVPATPQKKASGWGAMAKMLRGQTLDDTEQALIEKALISGTNAVSGENYLIPEDVRTDIREMRKSYVSARDLVNVIPVDTLSGSSTFESGTPTGLTAFDDGDTIATEPNPTFVQKGWRIAMYGKIIPISRVLGTLATGLMAYIKRWFVRSAVLTENAKIFATLKSGYNSGTPKTIAGWNALKASINKDLDPSCLLDGVIATNQSGFACLDDEVDANGRPILQPNPADPTQKLFQGLPIKVYPDAQLANIDETHFPIFYGATRAGADFMDFESLLFEASEHFMFNKGQTCLRVTEGFTCYSTDTGAYIYGSFSATPAPTTADKTTDADTNTETPSGNG